MYPTKNKQRYRRYNQNGVFSGREATLKSGAMPQYTAILRTSTRVLMALAEHQKPSDRDVARLQRFAPERAHEDIYVLASYVAQEALQKRREIRAAAAEN
jgi:hypothetical protein